MEHCSGTSTSDYQPDSHASQGLNSAQRHQCPVCFKNYKRREHLVRHAGSHKPDRPHRCGSCRSTFQRADILRRHVRSCYGDGSKPGAKKRACVRCAHHKKACGSERPCQGCLKKGLPCFDSSEKYAAPENQLQITNSQDSLVEKESTRQSRQSRQDEDALAASQRRLSSQEQQFELFQDAPLNNVFGEFFFDYSDPDWQEYLLFSSESQVLRENPLVDTSQNNGLRFLDGFTSNTGFISSFDCCTQEEREHIASILKSESLSKSHPDTVHMSPLLDDPYVSCPLLDNISDPSTENAIPSDWLSDPLSRKTHEILLLVEEVVKTKARNSPVIHTWSPTLRNLCLQFFSPNNIRRLLGLYWAIWYPNMNLVHRPTFDPVSAKPALIAAMVLTGACVSPDESDAEDAHFWFNCVEEIVFIDDDFNVDSTYGSVLMQRPKIQILQAAYMVCILQNWEGSDSSKARVRRHRFASLVSATRDMGIQTAMHLNCSALERQEFKWEEFAVREELIRVFTWTFLLDTAFVIFHNLPPRMVIREMRMHMAVPEACFQAMTADECYRNLRMHLPSDSPYWRISMRSAFESLSKSIFPDCMCTAIGSLGPLNLFALTSAIHSQIFYYRSSVSTSQNLTPITNTLRNWRTTWDTFASMSSSKESPHITINTGSLQPDTMWKRIGFFRHCPEYWLLATLMADRLALLGLSEKENEQALHDDGQLDPILRNYDQTSMRQVNDLILGFKAFQL